jgi:DNA-binding winged helix-turn-helix (wHTH) protein/predicted ATPase
MGDAPAVRIEAENEWAWCGEQRLPLMPRAFAVLRHLVEHAGRLITKDELLTSVWRDAVVSDAALTSCIRDLRKALRDSPETPRYIETVHRRGFRFIGPIARPATPPFARVAADARVERGSSPATATLVGREAELARLHEQLGRAMNGQRQLVFVTGEPGIGKTALVEAFLAQVSSGGPLRVGHGQCVEQYGAGEAYLPVLEALGRLGREARGDQIVHVLKQHAPTWLAQLPALLVDQDLEAVQRRAQGATRERMLRELVEGLDALTVDSPLVLVLEDLHWSDSATIDLLAMLARRREASRLLVLGTYRPADLAVSEHPLKAAKRELELHGQCEEIPLEFLSVSAVADYLSRRFAQSQWPAEFARMLQRRTDGNPLFLVNIVDDLLAQGQIHEVDGRWVLSVPVKDLAMEAPETLSQMVEKQIERLTPDEHAMLMVASVAGAEFSAAVATVDGIGVQEGERRCEALARRGQFLRAAGAAEWPDGTVAGRYAFIHALYQHVLYARVPVGRRVGLHLRTGERLEGAYGQRAGEIAGELAMHFTQGRDFARAARYHGQAGENALRQHGYREAADHLTQALDMLKALPDTQERIQQELTLHVMQGSVLTAMKGHAAREVEESYARARELSEHVEDTPRLFPVLLGLGWFYLIRGSLDAARDVGRRLLAMGETTRDPAILLAAHNFLGLASFYGGEFETALAHHERGIEINDPTAHSPARSSALRLILDPGMSCTIHAAWTLWILGYPARATLRLREALALSHSLAHPFTLAHACRFAAAFHLSRRERDAMQEQAETSVAVSTEHGFVAVLTAANFHLGWLLADQGREEEGLAPMRAWVTACREIRSECLLPGYRAWLAEMYGKLGRPREGLDLVAEALVAATQSGNHYWTAELHRLRGALTATEKDAESSFVEAMAIARRQGAKSFELRAATSLSRLWAHQGKMREAHALLAEVHAWFTEGFDTADLEDARALLEEVERAVTGLASVRTGPQDPPRRDRRDSRRRDGRSGSRA